MSRPCVICTAPSDYAHYGITSCRSCADFFKRTVDANRTFVCRRGDGKCIINPKDRRGNCRGCRFEKCRKIGMRLPDEPNSSHGREFAEETISDQPSAMLNSCNIVNNPNSSEVVIDRVILNLRKIEDAFNRLRCSQFNPLSTSIRSLDEALSGSSKLSVNYGEMQGWPINYSSGYRDVIQGSFHDNLIKRMLIGLNTNIYRNSNRKAWYFCNVVYSIEYFKAFDVFISLSSNTKRILAGKMVLLCANLSNAHFSMKSRHHSDETDTIRMPDGTALLEGMQAAFSKDHELSVSFIQSLRNMSIDDNEYVLMKALLILSPSLEDASMGERALLTSHSESYAKILLSYVLARRGRAQGPRIYQQMLALIDAINHRTKMERDVQVLMGALGMYKLHNCPLLEEIMLV